MTSYVFITGGVVSSLGKGLAAASMGALLESRGLKVTILKMDPYINVDPGTMNPLQHGEVFVTDDGAEADLDLGHYERFARVKMGKSKTWPKKAKGMGLQPEATLVSPSRLPLLAEPQAPAWPDIICLSRVPPLR